MKSKMNYTPELKGALLSVLILTVLVITNRLPQRLAANNAWLAGITGVAAVVVVFVMIMYKRVTNLKQNSKKQNT